MLDAIQLLSSNGLDTRLVLGTESLRYMYVFGPCCCWGLEPHRQPGVSAEKTPVRHTKDLRSGVRVKSRKSHLGGIWCVIRNIVIK